MQYTLVIIKPDAFERGLVGRILTRFEDAGLILSRVKADTPDEAQWKRHYAEHEGKPFFDDLIQTMSTKGNRVLVVLLKGHNAIERVRAMIGCTQAIEAAPGTIRGDFGREPGARNLIHASDSEESVIREEDIWFGG